MQTSLANELLVFFELFILAKIDVKSPIFHFFPYFKNYTTFYTIKLNCHILQPHPQNQEYFSYIRLWLQLPYHSYISSLTTFQNSGFNKNIGLWLHTPEPSLHILIISAFLAKTVLLTFFCLLLHKNYYIHELSILYDMWRSLGFLNYLLEHRQGLRNPHPASGLLIPYFISRPTHPN